MLQVSFIREHKAEAIERLSKRTNDAKSLIDAVIQPFYYVERISPSSIYVGSML